MLILMFLLLGCPTHEDNCINGYNGYGPTTPSCWQYLPCSDMAWPLASRYSATCRPDQDSTIQWEPTNGPRVENEDRVGGVLVCTCRSTP